MSYHTYTVDGFGFSTDNINTDVARIKKLLTCAPKFKKQVDDYFEDCEIAEPELDDYLEYDQDCMSGIAYIIQQVIEEAEDINLDIAEDFDGEWYVLLCPSYPWVKISKKQKSLTVKKIAAVFQKYIDILTDCYVKMGYQSVENGG